MRSSVNVLKAISQSDLCVRDNWCPRCSLSVISVASKIEFIEIISLKFNSCKSFCL